MSLSSLLSIARSALATRQRALEVASHNIANATTPGFSRQRLETLAAVPLRDPRGTIGRGVTDLGISRIRDQFLDQAFRRESGSLGGAGVTSDLLSRVEEILGEPSDTGLAAGLDALFGAFGDLANDPSSNTARSLLLSAAGRVTADFRATDAQLGQIRSDASTQLTARVDEANDYLAQIAQLNRQIVVAGGPSHSAPDLEDQRDVLLDRLSALVSVRVLDRNNGAIAVVAGDTLLVDEAGAQRLAVRSVPGGLGVGVELGTGTISLGAGQLDALSRLVTTTVPAIVTGLDRLASSLVAEVNAIHRSGYSATGVTGADFFDPAGTTAATLRLDPLVDGTPSAVAAGATANPGDGAIALQLAALRNQRLAGLGNTTPGEYFTQLTGAIGASVRNAQQATDVSGTLVSAFDARRAATSGVSVDEEMVSLISEQQGYAAAARVVSVATTIIDDLLRLV